MVRKNKNKHIPDRWMDYEPIKHVIEEIKIVPFKVPLPIFRFHDDAIRGYKWTPSDVMHKIPDLGLVIDLTFKYPCYYEPMEFLENGVDYVKIGCPGHVIPPDKTFFNFCDTIDAFHQEHPELIIGVHCTHGINRTGYMICRYMVERRGFSAEQALKIFADMRGYEVERDNYIQKIHSLEMAVHMNIQ